MASPLRKLAHSTTAPVREFFNWHFEMVKAEVRSTHANVTPGTDRSTADLESAVVEQSLHQARSMTRVSTDLARIDSRLAELERVVERLVDVVAASTLTADEEQDEGHTGGPAEPGRPT